MTFRTKSRPMLGPTSWIFSLLPPPSPLSVTEEGSSGLLYSDHCTNGLKSGMVERMACFNCVCACRVLCTNDRLPLLRP